MGWLALSERSHGFLPLAQGDDLSESQDRLLVRGSLVCEFQLPDRAGLAPVLQFQQAGDWPIGLGIFAVPQGGISVVLEQSGRMWHHDFPVADVSRGERFRLTLAWDAPNRSGRVSLEQLDMGCIRVVPIIGTKPWRFADLLKLLSNTRGFYFGSDVAVMSFSDTCETIGPLPGLPENALVKTPAGVREIAQLQTGDLVFTTKGKTVPVLAVINQQRLDFGGAQSIELRAPFWKLEHDMRLAGDQHVLVEGVDVSYLFGSGEALVSARDLPPPFVSPRSTDQFVQRSWQIVLPKAEHFFASGLPVPSLNCADIWSCKALHDASVVSHLPAEALAGHRQSGLPRLSGFDVKALASARVA